MERKSVQEQFGASAAAYATSKVHAEPSYLAHLVEIAQPRPEWIVLDVATGAGHTALAFASRVRHVVAADLTPEMLAVARRLAVDKIVENVSYTMAEAGGLPFASESIDLVTCRLAAHHFPAIGRFMTEAARVLRPGGKLLVVDNIVSGSSRRGKQAEGLRRAGRYVNAFETLRDPSHVRALHQDEWLDHFFQAGFTIRHQETQRKRLDFADWAARMAVSPENWVRLEIMLRQAPETVDAFLTPQFETGRIVFWLTELIMIGEL